MENSLVAQATLLVAFEQCYLLLKGKVEGGEGPETRVRVQTLPSETLPGGSSPPDPVIR